MPPSKQGRAHRHARRRLCPVQLRPPGRPIDNRPDRFGAGACRPTRMACRWRIHRRSDLWRVDSQPPGSARPDARRFDAVLTESLDRLSRDLADSAALHRQLAYWGVRIVTLADGDVTKMLVAVKGLLGSMFLDEHRAAHLCRIRRRALATEDRAGPECRGNPGASGRGGHWNVSALLGSAKRCNG